MLSFDNNFTSRVEDVHSKLKRTLKIFIDDFKKVINIIKLILKNEKTKYFIAHENAKTRISRNCDIIAFEYVQDFISFYALKLINKQLDKVIRFQRASDSRFTSVFLFSCTKTYETSMRLSCAHFLKRR